ncbi:MAG: tetratricopeptide repeat protein [Rhodanobacter sp.]
MTSAYLRRHAAAALLVFALLLVTAIYWSGLSGSWLFDDYPNIVDNHGVQPSDTSLSSLVNAALSSPSSEFKRPLASLSFAANYLASGLDPYAMKLTNLLIHLLNGMLVFLLARTLLRHVAKAGEAAFRGSASVGGASAPTTDSPVTTSLTVATEVAPTTSSRADLVAVLIAAGWMLLPINLTGVLYVVQRMESMANLFVLLGLIGYVAGRQRMLATEATAFSPDRTGHSAGTRGFLLCLLSITVPTALGVLAKETAVMLPLYALLVEWALFRWRKRGAQTVGGDFSPWESLTTSAHAATPVGRALPAALHRDHPDNAPAGSARPTAMGRSEKEWRVIALFLVVLVLPMLLGLSWLLPPLLHPEAWATRDFTLGTRLLSEARIVVDYIDWTLLPTPQALSFYHDDFAISTGLLTPWTTLASMVLLAALIALMCWLRRRQPLVALGIALFLGCQLLTGTILPLELIYEHRNYFASFGLLLAIVPLLAAPRAPPAFVGATSVATSRSLEGTSVAAEAAPTGKLWATGALPLAGLRYALLAGLMLYWATLTALTAYAWGDPLRLAQDLANRAPQSPRAQYELGRTYIIYSRYDPASPYTQLAYAPLEKAASFPESSILPQQALIFMNSRMGRPLKSQWWDSMIAKLRARKPGVQDESSLVALTQCVREQHCDLPQARMVQAFEAALDHPRPSARLQATYGDYAWNVLDDHALGLRMIEGAVKDAPSEPAYRITLVRMLVTSSRPDAAMRQIQALQQLNIGGRLNSSIRELRQQIDAATNDNE